MEAKGIPTTRWFDAVLAKPDEIDQPAPVKAMMVFGHGGNTVTRMPEMRKGLEALDLLVVADPHPTTFASVSGRKNGTYLLPICTQFEADGSRTASNRSIQWGDRVVEPIFELKNDYDVMYALATRLGFGAEMFKRIKVVNGQPDAGRHPAGNQLRLAFDRVFGPVAGAAAASYGASGRLRPDDAEGFDQGRARVSITGCRGRAGARRS